MRARKPVLLSTLLILACADDGRTLAMGSTTGGLWVSEDDTKTFRARRETPDRTGGDRRDEGTVLRNEGRVEGRDIKARS